MKNFLNQFGGKVTREWEEKYQQSANWYDGSFQNLEDTALTASLLKMPGIIYKQLSKKKGREPLQPIPFKPFDQKAFLAPSKDAKMIWYGHSAILMRMEGINILIDPMLGPDTTPIAPIPTKRFTPNTIGLINDFPDIDLMLITHDHYDHLDFASIQKLKLKTRRYFVALGVKRHLIHWGIPSDLITEFDWWQSKRYEGIEITFTPTRHFSGRGLTDRQKTLWGGWSIISSTERIWFSGDGGYGNHFKEVGERLGPFDFAFMESGQYNEDWRPIHLFPDESVQAALDAGVKKAMPVHWAGFYLSYQHTWQEPAELFVQAARESKLNYMVPPIGQMFAASNDISTEWWRSNA